MRQAVVAGAVLMALVALPARAQPSDTLAATPGEPSRAGVVVAQGVLGAATGFGLAFVGTSALLLVTDCEGWGCLGVAAIGAVVLYPVGAAAGVYKVGTSAARERASFGATLGGAVVGMGAGLLLLSVAPDDDTPLVTVTALALPVAGGILGYDASRRRLRGTGGGAGAALFERGAAGWQAGVPTPFVAARRLPEGWALEPGVVLVRVRP